MNDRWNECKQYMVTHLQARVSLSALGHVARLHPDYLCRAFKRDVGVSPHQYLVGLRVHRARDLLARGQRPIDVAIDSGFTDQSHLTRLFKRYFGTTPAEFQRSISAAGEELPDAPAHESHDPEIEGRTRVGPGGSEIRSDGAGHCGRVLAYRS